MRVGLFICDLTFVRQHGEGGGRTGKVFVFLFLFSLSCCHGDDADADDGDDDGNDDSDEDHNDHNDHNDHDDHYDHHDDHDEPTLPSAHAVAASGKGPALLPSPVCCPYGPTCGQSILSSGPATSPLI